MFPSLHLNGCCETAYSIRDPLTSQTAQSIIIGLPRGAMPNRKMEAALSVQQKDKMVDRTPRRLCMSHSNFCREGVGHFRSSGEQMCIWNEHNHCVESLALYLGRMIV